MFRSLTDMMVVSPQIDLDGVKAARDAGITLIINNRPEDEEPGQVTGPAIEAAALALGLSYIAIPVTHSGFSQPQVKAMADALDAAVGPVLAYCRSGTRSCLLWSLAEASQGAEPDDLTEIASGAGYDVTPIRPLLDMLKAQA